MTLTFEERIRQYHEMQTGGARPEASPAASDDPFGEVRDDIRQRVLASVGSRLYRAGAEHDADLHGIISDAASTCMVEDYRHVVTGADRERVLADLTDEILGHGPIERFLRDETVTEIMCNGPDAIFVERSGRIERTDVRFDSDEHLLRVIERIVGRVNRRIDSSSPMVDARLPDGSRVHAIIEPLSLIGPCLTIRKFRADPYVMSDLVELGTLTPLAAKFLKLCVQGAANVLVSGGTGSGKTTTLNVMSAAIPGTERIVTIEDAAELQLAQEHVIPLETRPDNIEGHGQVSIRDLVRTSLRMRPDRIVVGEVRGPEALDMLQSMNTGHDGSMTTIHANTPREALSRLETLVLTAGTDLPLRAIREQVASAIDVIVQVSRLVDGSRRVVAITEVVGMEGDTVTIQDLFVARPIERETRGASPRGALYGPLGPVGSMPRFADNLAGNGVHIPVSIFAQ